MSSKTRLIPYPEERALEDAAYARNVVPTRIFALLLPVWSVEVKATITDGEPYELIDRYLERGIAEAGLTTVAELGDFFALDHVLVDRALRFLVAIGHVTTSHNRLALTDLGLRSLHDQVRYVVTREDRRKMYFDAFGSRPLTRPYYDPRKVTLLLGESLEAAVAERDGSRFQMMSSFRGFRREALAELAARTDREHYNLPERIDHPESGGEVLVYLPMYVIRGVQQGNPRYLAYTQAGEEADEYVTALCEGTPDIVDVLASEERVANVRFDHERVGEWLRRKDLGRHQLIRLPDGSWRVILPGSSFGPNGALPITKIGSFVVLGSDLFHVWCADEKIRSKALLERLDSYLGARVRSDREDVEKRIARIARQLDLGDLDGPTLRKMAEKADKRSLSAQLERLF